MPNSLRKRIRKLAYQNKISDKDLERIINALDKATELESRKDKLIVGSEWECIVECYASSSFNYAVGDIIEFGDFNDGFVLLDEYYDFDNVKTRIIMPLQQFLLCFKPIEREAEE